MITLYGDDLAWYEVTLVNFFVSKLFPSKCSCVSLYQFHLIHCITDATVLFGYVMFSKLYLRKLSEERLCLIYATAYIKYIRNLILTRNFVVIIIKVTLVEIVCNLLIVLKIERRFFFCCECCVDLCLKNLWTTTSLYVALKKKTISLYGPN